MARPYRTTRRLRPAHFPRAGTAMLQPNDRKMLWIVACVIGVVLLAYLLRKRPCAPDCINEPDHPACKIKP